VTPCQVSFPAPKRQELRPPSRGWDQMPSIGLKVEDEMNPPVPIGGFAIDGAAQ